MLHHNQWVFWRSEDWFEFPKVGRNLYCGGRSFVFDIKIWSELMTVEESHVESDNISTSFLQLFQNFQVHVQAKPREAGIGLEDLRIPQQKIDRQLLYWIQQAIAQANGVWKTTGELFLLYLTRWVKYCNDQCSDVAANSMWALIWYWDHLKIFIAEIPQGPLWMSIGTIWMTQKRFQGPPARGFSFF